MCRYDGGCSLCGGDKGSFDCCLPNGVSIHNNLIGYYLCDNCTLMLTKSQTFRHRVIQQRRLEQAWLLHRCRDEHDNDYGDNPWWPSCDDCKKDRWLNYKYCREGGKHYIQVGRYGLFAKDNPV